MIVTSARMVVKSLSVATRFSLPWGGEKPGLGGDRDAIVTSCDTDRWEDQIIEAMH